MNGHCLTRQASDDEAYRFIRTKSCRPEWLGEFGEAIWRNILTAAGWNYISLSKIAEGGAPLAHGPHGKTILPDYDAYKDGRSVFVESKAKSQSIIYRLRNQERHGINYKNWMHYQTIQQETGKPCCIALVELERETDRGLVWSGSLLFETMTNLAEVCRTDYPENPPKVYWPRKRFCDLGQFTPQELRDIANGKMRPSFAYELERIICPQKQQALFY